MKKVIPVIMAVFLLASCGKTDFKLAEGYMEQTERSTYLTIRDNEKSVKKKSAVLIDGAEFGYKTEKINEQFRKKEYKVSAKDGTEIFTLRPMDSAVVSDKSFSVYGLFDYKNTPLAYIQDGVFRGKECYILYSGDTSRYAFCEKEKADKGTYKPQYNIISFDDELLYRLNVEENGEGSFEISSERMRPDSINEVSALAVAILIDDYEYNNYVDVKNIENKKKKG